MASRSSRSDSVFVALTAAHAAALVLAPSVPVVAIGLWWNANTIAHNFIHRPFFRRRGANRAFSAVLSLVLGVPQALWRVRHLAHHASTEARQKPPTFFRTPGAWIDVGIVVALFATLALFAPWFLLTVYLPGWLAGLAICQIHGHYEHAHGTTSHYGRVYNLLFFNDGYHVEHHARPHVHWRDLPSAASAHSSRWPAALRWLDAVSLTGLERLVLRSSWLQHLVVDAHARAIAQLLPSIGAIDRVTIVGGGLFPRTAIVLRRLLPDATLTIVDADFTHLESARAFAPAGVRLIHATYDQSWSDDSSLVVVPLAFDGNRALEYAHPRAPAVLVHDWIWCRRGSGAVVAWWLLKRVNLVLRETAPAHDSVFECARPAW